MTDLCFQQRKTATKKHGACGLHAPKRRNANVQDNITKIVNL